MDINEYSKLAMRTANDLGEQGNINHAVLGIGSEAGEILDAFKKHFAYGKPLDKSHMLEEASDLAWFLNLLIVSLGSTWEQVLTGNIAKLEKRYPNLKFDAGHATNRDKASEVEAFNAAANL